MKMETSSKSIALDPLRVDTNLEFYLQIFLPEFRLRCIGRYNHS